MKLCTDKRESFVHLLLSGIIDFLSVKMGLQKDKMLSLLDRLDNLKIELSLSV